MRKIIFLVLSVFVIALSVNTVLAEKVSETPKGPEELFDELKSDNLVIQKAQVAKKIIQFDRICHKQLL